MMIEKQIKKTQLKGIREVFILIGSALLTTLIISYILVPLTVNNDKLERLTV